MAAVGFDWIFFAIVVPWPLLAVWELMRTRSDMPRSRP